ASIAYFTLNGADDFTAVFGAGQVFVAPAAGGEPKRIATSFSYARFPIWSPDGRYLLFTGTSGDGVRDWWLAPLDGSAPVRTRALQTLSQTLNVIGYPDQWRGDRIYFSGAEETNVHVWQVSISPDSLQVVGSPKRLTNGEGQEQQT